MATFRDIKPFTRSSRYSVDIPLGYLESALERYFTEGLNLEPEFQRAHVLDRVLWIIRDVESYLYENFPDPQEG